MLAKVFAVLVVMVAIVSCFAAAEQDLPAAERQEMAELAAQILRMTRGPWSAAEAHKRNSGMINSILGIPRVMVEAGKR
ncbi:pigment-dispersing hormone type 1-like [Macrobrachium rosenbergii]|uniref:pigment-dispersing hormone type 1-like n=1 Tax=Macrobrachium rosenbergii TaxID=79674 RepID=UPI0034D57C3E